MGKDDDITEEGISTLIQDFFTMQHTEAGKPAKSHDLITLRQETIGQGTFSRIRLAEVKNRIGAHLTEKGVAGVDDSLRAEVSSGVFALKVMKKTEVLRLKQAEHVKHEVKILGQCNHPFIVTMFHHYSDDRNLYELMEFVQLGTVDQLIEKQRGTPADPGPGRLPDSLARFYAAQAVMAVQYLHQEHIIYRDLQPRNMMLDRHQYLKLVDFGLAKPLNLDDSTARTWTLVGTAEYMAPELIQSKGHGKEVDWWALGIVIYEMLAGYTPAFAKQSFETYKMVLEEKWENPRHFDRDASDLVSKLLTKPVKKRLGSAKTGAEDIKKHKWFRGLNWAALYNKQMEPPAKEELHYRPLMESPTSTAHFELIDEDPSWEQGTLDKNDERDKVFDDWGK